MRVFLSYSRHDQSALEELVLDLEAGHHDVWRDERLSGGQEWWNRILEEIRSAELFIFALSEHSLASAPCRAEYEYAAALRKRILPIRLDRRTSVQELPEALSQLQWIQFEQGDKRSALKMLGSIQNLPAAEPPPSTPPTPPTIPVSYLGELRDRIVDPGQLTHDAQIRLLNELEARLTSGDDPLAIENMLVRIERRSDVSRANRRRSRALRRRIEESQPRSTQPRRDLRFIAAAVGGMMVVALIAGTLIVVMNRAPAAGDAVQGDDNATATTTPRDSSRSDATPSPSTTIRAVESPPPETEPAQPATTVVDATVPEPDYEQTDASPPSDVDDIDLGLLAQFLTSQSFATDLGCSVEVQTFAANLGLPWQYFGTDLWYWNQAAFGWLRWDGFIYYPSFGTYVSFCTGRQWDPNAALWF